MRPIAVACFSDTHGRHQQLIVPASDLLLCAGDFTARGGRDEVLRFVDWFALQPAAQRVLIAGNHDRWCEEHPDEVASLCAEREILWLLDSGVEVLGWRLWGSPVTPTFRSMAFNRARGPALSEHWARVPADTDILITHGPPRGLLDRMALGRRVGSDELRRELPRVRPRLHVFGHIHEAAGRRKLDGTLFVNAACARPLRRRLQVVTTLALSPY